jgi:hypothetical protein
MPHHCSKRAPSASSSIFLQQTCTCQPSACPACILRPLPAELHWGHESQPVCNGGERKRRQVVLQTISSSSCRCALIICAPPEEDLDPGDFFISSSHKGAQRWMSRVWLPAMYLSASCVDSNAHIATVGMLRLHSTQEGINCSSKVWTARHTAAVGRLGLFLKDVPLAQPQARLFYLLCCRSTTSVLMTCLRLRMCAWQSLHPCASKRARQVTSTCRGYQR